MPYFKANILTPKRGLTLFSGIILLVLLAGALGYATSRLQQMFYSEEFTILHICLWIGVLLAIAIHFAHPPQHNGVPSLSPEQSVLQTRLASLTPLARQCFTLSCCQRLHGCERNLAQPEAEEVVEFRQRTLTAMWDAVFVPNGFDSTIYFEQGKKFVPHADESPAADDPNFDMCKMLPFLVVLENWPCDTVGASFQTAMFMRDVIDQIVMDELADGKFDPGSEMAERIAAGVAWKSDDGLRCHPMMKRELEFEYLDLGLLQTAAMDETTIKTVKERSSLAWKAR